jgi:hypothetical protein
MGIMMVAVPLAVLLLLYAFSARKMTRSYRIEDLPLVLRAVNLEQLEKLLDPAEEANLRKTMSHRAFRRTQLSRLGFAMEQAKRLAHNAAILETWANQEFTKKLIFKSRSNFDSADHAVLRVIQNADEIRRQTLLMMSKIFVWRVMLTARIAFMPVPRLADLRELLGYDLLETYESLTSAAGQLGLVYGDREYEQLLAAL